MLWVLPCARSFSENRNPHLAVTFKQVVHSDRTEGTGVIIRQIRSEGPNEHPQECPVDAPASRGNGAVGASGPTFQSPGCIGLWRLGEIVAPDQLTSRSQPDRNFPALKRLQSNQTRSRI